MAFKGGVVVGPVSLNATGSATTTIGNTAAGLVTIDCGTAGITVGTTANAHQSTFGSTNSTSSTRVQSGSGALAVTSTNGTLTINSGTGVLGISSDASATTVNLATGAAVKLTTLGSTTTTSSTVIKSGSGNVAINSGLTIDSTGRMTNATQPIFFTKNTSLISNVTGDGTTYLIVYNTEVVDQGANLSSAIFTAPVTGQYFFTMAVQLTGIGAGHTSGYVSIVTTGYTAIANLINPTAVAVSSGQIGLQCTALVNMTAGQTASANVTLSGSTKTVNISDTNTYFSGYLVG